MNERDEFQISSGDTERQLGDVEKDNNNNNNNNNNNCHC